MKKFKKISLVVILMCVMLITFVPQLPRADALDDAINGTLQIGQVVSFKGWSWYYMGGGYFICTQVAENKAFDSSGYNGWHRASLNSYLNGDFYTNTLSSDSRIAYVTIPSLEEYELLANMGKGNEPNYWNYWLRSPYPDNFTHSAWCVANNGLVHGYSVGSSAGVRPAFRLKSEISGGGGGSADATDAKNTLRNGADNNNKSLAATYDAAKTAADNSSRPPVIKVVKGQAFTKVINGEISGTGTVGSDTVTASSTASSGYTTLTGTLNTVGGQKVTITQTTPTAKTLTVIFEVSDVPATGTPATVIFGE